MRIKVLFVIANLARGGAERVLSDLLRYIDKSRFEPVLAIFDSKISYPVPSFVKIYNLQVPPVHGIKKFFNYLFKIYRLKKLLDAERPNIVFSFMIDSNLLVLITKIFLSYKPKTIISERTNLPVFLQYSNIYIKIVGLLIPSLYKKAGAVVTVSKGAKAGLVYHLKVPEHKVRVIYNGVDEAAINSSVGSVEHKWFSDSVPIIISAGRIDRWKDYATALKAFSIVRKKHNCRYVVLGDGPERENLKILSAKLGIERDIAFMGIVENPWAYMKRASIFVLSSLYEGFPNVVLEAMACGVPVIATDCPSGPNEIIENGKNGILVPVGDEVKLSEAMGLLLADERLRIRIAQNGRERANNFNINYTIKEYEMLIDNVIKGNI